MISRVADEICGLTTVEMSKNYLQLIIENFGFFGLCHAHLSSDDNELPIYTTTLGKAWEDEYVSGRFYVDNPITALARRSNVPFLWSSVERGLNARSSKQSGCKVLQAARDHGFTEGLVFPFHFADGFGAGLSILNELYWTDDASKLGEFLSSNSRRHELNLILMAWSERVGEIARAEACRESKRTCGSYRPERPMQLTDRERSVLMWAGRGHTAGSTGEILKISTETVQTHIKNAIIKLGAVNKTHAVAKAMIANQIYL